MNAEKTIELLLNELPEKRRARFVARVAGINTVAESRLAYRPREAARMLNTSRVTLHRWAKSGVLVPRKIGGVVLYARNQLVKFVEGKSA